MEMTETHKKMYEAFGHKVEVYIFGREQPFVGKCVGYTPPLDNEPEIASIDIQRPRCTTSVTELFEHQIERIIIKD